MVLFFFWWTIGLRKSPYQKFAELKNLSHLSTVIFTTKRFVRFIYRFSYLLTYYYSFLAHYNKKCFDINWFHLLSPAILSLWYSRFEVTWLLRDDSNSKTHVRFVFQYFTVSNSVYFLSNNVGIHFVFMYYFPIRSFRLVPMFSGITPLILLYVDLQ
jgi:hypothetical protein